MFGYFAKLDQKYRLPVYPIALFSHDSPSPEPDSYRVSFPDRDVLRFRFRTIQLKRLRWRKFVRQPNPVASALMAKMGFQAKERVQVKLECLRLLATFKLSPAKQRLISGFVDIYLRLNEKETLQFEHRIATLPDREQAKVMELTTSWKEEGLKEGRQEGRRDGEQELVLRLLKRQCGDLSPSLEKQVRRLSVKPLESLAEALLDFSSLSDLEMWLSRAR
jgi:hypothetical protein